MSEAYRRAGVDLEAAAGVVGLVKDIAARATRPEVVSAVGGFAGLYDLGDGRLLAAATDGVGTKTEIARELGRLDTVGIDLVAMCANDVVCTGAQPVLFLDYVAAGRVVPGEVAEIVEGVAEGCRHAGCALLGGETAEHPGVMEEGRFDLAGFCVGIVRREDLLDPAAVRTGDAIVGIPSSGLHSNGFSLVRRVVAEAGLDLDAGHSLSRPLGEELLEPTRIYVREVLAAAATGAVRSSCHVTGGGIRENLLRALPEGLGARLDPSAWERPPVLAVLAEAGNLSEEDVAATFNLGLGMLLVVDPNRLDVVLATIPDTRQVGKVTEEPGVTW